MKLKIKLLYALALVGALDFASLPLLMLVGCRTPQSSQTVAYKSIYSVQKATLNSYEAYISAVINGKLATNHVPDVSKRFNEFQAASQVAITAAQWNTNAPASEQLSRMSADLINLIATITKQ